MKPLIRLLYISRINQAEYGPDTTSTIIRVAETHNAQNFITGLLAFNHAHFIQCLEGPRDRISTLMTRIASDSRHCDLQIVECVEVDARWFEGWSMAYHPLDDGELDAVEETVDVLSASKLAALFHHLSTLRKTA